VAGDGRFLLRAVARLPLRVNGRPRLAAVAAGIFLRCTLGFSGTFTGGFGLLLALRFHCALAVFVGFAAGVFLCCTLGFSGTFAGGFCLLLTLVIECPAGIFVFG
jgi:hypothetical protein